MLYHTLTDFEFTPDLIKKIKSLATGNLEIATRFTGSRVFKILKNQHKLSWFSIVKDWALSYGIFFSKCGTMDSLKLPTDINDQILNQLQLKFDKSVIDDCEIRLQAVYGNQILLPHIDLTRTTSLIYPLSNHSDACTMFFDISRSIKSHEQIFRLSEIKKNTQVTIDQYPVIMDVKKIHAVCWPIPIARDNPRLSLSIKWKTLTIEEILMNLKKFNVNVVNTKFSCI